MAQAAKGNTGTDHTRHKTKLSREKNEPAKVGKSEDSDLPKLSHRSRKTLTGDQQALLKQSFGDLCSPQLDGENRLSDWLEVNARKDKDIKHKDIKNWVDGYKRSGNFMSFSVPQLLNDLDACNFKPEAAVQYANSLIVRKTAFNSIESFEAAQAVIKRIRKGNAEKPEKLLKSVSGLGAGEVKRENLHKAITDVGLKSPVIKELLNAALNVMDPELDPDLDPERFAHEVKSMSLAVERLGKPTKLGSSVRYSAPIGTFSVGDLNELAKQAKSVTITANLPRQRSGEKHGEKHGEKSPAESPPASPRKEVHREHKSVGKDRSKSRTDLDSDLSPERARKKENNRNESAGKRTREDSPVKKKQDDSKATPGGHAIEATVATFTTSTSTTTTATSPASGGGRHKREASGQGHALVGSLKQKFGEKNQAQNQ